MALTSLVGMEQDGPDKHSAFWVKPVWLCGLAGVTHVFPVSLHPKGLLLNMCVCVRMQVCVSPCLLSTHVGMYALTVRMEGCLFFSAHKENSTLI